jgi:hypothetical protein
MEIPYSSIHLLQTPMAILSSSKLAIMSRVEVNPPSENTLYLRLFITNGGGL